MNDPLVQSVPNKCSVAYRAKSLDSVNAIAGFIGIQSSKSRHQCDPGRFQGLFYKIAQATPLAQQQLSVALDPVRRLLPPIGQVFGQRANRRRVAVEKRVGKCINLVHGDSHRTTSRVESLKAAPKHRTPKSYAAGWSREERVRLNSPKATSAAEARTHATAKMSPVRA